MSLNMITTSNVKELLTGYCIEREQCGFEAYVVVRSEPRLRRVILHDAPSSDDEETSFKKRTRNMLLDVLSESFLGADTEYASVSTIADDQHKVYLIPQAPETYSPFEFLSSTTTGSFRTSDIDEAIGLAFALRKGTDTLWLYQHLWSILVPNKKKNNLLARICHFENDYVFHEQKEPLLTIARKIDIVILNNTCITRNIQLMQKSFGFQDYIRINAEHTIERIKQNGIVENPGKLNEYMARSQPKYAKKLMRIVDSRVLNMSTQELIERISMVDRWRDRFVLTEDQGSIVLQTFAHVEMLIDLLDERFTRSEITGTEYDTDVKQIAQPLNHEE